MTQTIISKAAQAESIFANESESIAVLLTDLILPDLNGHELYLRLNKRKEGLKVVYMSGYADEMLANYGLDLH